MASKFKPTNNYQSDTLMASVLYPPFLLSAEAFSLITYKDEHFCILPVYLNQGQSGDITPAIERDLLWQVGE